MVVLVFTIISFLVAFAIAIKFLLSENDKPFYLIAVAIIMALFGNGKYNFDVFTVHQNNYAYIILAIILICSAYKAFKKYTDRKSFVEYLVIFIIIFFVLWTGCDRYVNYGFDLSKEIHADLIIEKQIGDSYGLPGYYGYAFLEYKVKPNDFKIETIDISDEYKLNPGDSVKITYRKGFHTPLYSTEYDVSWLLPGPLFSNP